MTSIQTDLSVSPYFDDYSDQKDFYKVLFRPGVSVQTRELNQLQTILQKQIERFGNNIFRQGTIIEGCSISYHKDLQYVKIRDVETDSTGVIVSKYQSYRVKNQNDLIPLEAYVLSTASGFEATSPDLNTLYVRYINSGFKTGGAATGQSKFEASELLTVYDPKGPVEKVIINDGSSGFVTTDKVVFLPAIAIQNTSGGTAFANNFYVGDYVSDGTANVEIVGVDSNTRSDAVILKIAPRTVDLKTGDYTKWTLQPNNNIQTVNATPSSIARVLELIGSGAEGSIATGTLGAISSINVTQKGTGYTIAPYVAVTSISATEAQIDLFSATAQTYLANITVAGSQYAPIGNSYGMSIGGGVIYQKGYFSRVKPQFLVVEKYSNRPDAKSVGFQTDESIINSNQDVSLLDNATGAPNYTAPGANRLSLTPRLVALTKTEADSQTDFLYITEFSEGYPYKQNRQTVYNIVGKEINRRFNETAGNYVINPFLLNTKSPSSFATEATKFNILIDPGAAYINGARVETNYNFESPVDKGIDTKQVNSGTISLNYGNYIKVNELGGNFIFNTGDLIGLYDTTATFITSNVGKDPTASGTKIGEARMRSLVYDSGVPGTASAVYRLYLFDINLNTGKNFSDVKSLFYDGSYSNAICDAVLENGKAIINDNINSSLIYSSGYRAIVNASSISYIFRTSTSNNTLGTTGTITFSVPSAGTQTFPYSGQLSSTQKRDIIVVPTANVESSTNLTGNVTTVITTTQVTGTGTTFLSQVRAGDYLKFGTAGFGQVASVTNNTILQLTSNAAVAVSANTFKYFFPANAPISLDRDTRTVTCAANLTQMTVDLSTSFSTANSVMAVAFNVRETVTPVAKTVNRNKFVRLCLANNVATNAGPWALGVGDVFRLNNIYKGSNGTFGTSGTDITKYFYVDHNQQEDYYGISYLYLKPNATISLSQSDWLLINFDYFTHSGEGVKAPGGSGTYPISDGTPLSAATTTIHTLEIPEVYGARGTYYDLRDNFDIRPLSTNTVTVGATAGAAPLNPLDRAANTRFASTDKKFPSPDSELIATFNYYQGRTDRVVVTDDSTFRVIKGTPGDSLPPEAPSNALTINIIDIPPYPTIPYQISQNTALYIDTKIANEKYSTKRLTNFRVKTRVTAADRIVLQPRGYTMEDIGKLERRIADLEYYTSVTLVEQMAQKKVIPGFDGTDRFKFGFFVDGFEGYTYSELTNPAYSAAIIDGFLAPRVEEIKIGTKTANNTSGTLQYNEFNYISQTRATDGPVVANTTPTTGTPSPTITTQIITNVNGSEGGAPYNQDGSLYTDYFFEFSEKSGPADLYLIGNGGNYACEIAQSSSSTGPWTTKYSSSSATVFESSYEPLVTFYWGAAPPYGTLTTVAPTQSTSFGNFISDAFRLSWTHSPSSGKYVRIRIYKGDSSATVGFPGPGWYGFNVYYPRDVTITESDISVYGLLFPGQDLDTQAFHRSLLYSATTTIGDTWDWQAYVRRFA